ncbi:MAG: hypothetical protein VX768_14620 [Planctomycetota bacterium]|nr:hypothetical protein [Planctomycetota bacterium]
MVDAGKPPAGVPASGHQQHGHVPASPAGKAARGFTGCLVIVFGFLLFCCCGFFVLVGLFSDSRQEAIDEDLARRQKFVDYVAELKNQSDSVDRLEQIRLTVSDYLNRNPEIPVRTIGLDRLDPKPLFCREGGNTAIVSAWSLHDPERVKNKKSSSLSNPDKLPHQFSHGVLRNIGLLENADGYASVDSMEIKGYGPPASELELLANLKYLVVVRRTGYRPPHYFTERKEFTPGEVLQEVTVWDVQQKQLLGCLRSYYKNPEKFTFKKLPEEDGSSPANNFLVADLYEKTRSVVLKDLESVTNGIFSSK